MRKEHAQQGGIRYVVDDEANSLVVQQGRYEGAQFVPALRVTIDAAGDEARLTEFGGRIGGLLVQYRFNYSEHEYSTMIEQAVRHASSSTAGVRLRNWTVTWI